MDFIQQYGTFLAEIATTVVAILVVALGLLAIFSKDKSIIMKFIQESPTIQGFPKGSPGRIGQYMGLRIIESYARKHPDKNLKEIIQEEDYAVLFNQSGYKPR